MPLAGADYKVFRNVKKFGAVGDGVTDDSDAINNAVSDGGRCGLGCSASSFKGALIYFPAGKYLISKPILQFYYTQFIGDPLNKPTIKGSSNFLGISLIDSNQWVPGDPGPDGNGRQW